MVLFTSITNEPLDLDGIQEIVRTARHREIVAFAGEARNSTAERYADFLHYEAEMPLAEVRMRTIAEEVAVEFGANIAVLHRIGEVCPGDTVLICVAACEKSADAFECCRRVVEKVRMNVPIWMREYDPELFELQAV